MEALIGPSMWGGVMAMMTSLVYFNKIAPSNVLMTLVYPLMLSAMSKSGYFQLNTQSVAIAGVITFLYTLLLRFSDKAKAAMDDPEKDITMSSVIFISNIFIFTAILYVLTRYGFSYQA